MVKCMRPRTTQSDKGQGSVPLLPGVMRDKIFFFFFTSETEFSYQCNGDNNTHLMW